jgi:crossover junction endodeoxyribonuclease RuvC
MVIIGFDPGSIVFGIGIIKKEKNKVSYVFSEELKLNGADLFIKMHYLWEYLTNLYQQFSLQYAAIEEGFLGKNVRSMSMLATVRGVVMASLIQAHIPLSSYSPRQIKQALTGCGQAQKGQLNRMIKILLNIQQDLGNDESDALATAYCHGLKLK